MIADYSLRSMWAGLNRAIVLLGALLFAAWAQAADFDLRYIPKQGDLNGDGRTDIFLEYRPEIVPIMLDDLTIPVVSRRQQVGEFVLLQQSDGTFAAASPSAAQRATMRGWQTAALKLLLSDADLDENIDVLIKNISSIVPGADDIIVYAPSATGEQPSAVKPIDAATKKLIRDLQGWFANHQTYYANAWIGVPSWVPTTVNEYDCIVGNGSNSVYFEPGSADDAWAFEHCDFIGVTVVPLLVYSTVFDSANYSIQAKAIADALAPFSDATTPVSDAAIQIVVTQISQTLGRPWFPDAVPGTPDWTDLGRILKDIARGAAAAGAVSAAEAAVIVIGVLLPNSTADDDTNDQAVTQAQVDTAGIEDATRRGDGFYYFYHTTLLSNVPSILSGIKVPQKRNFPGDDEAFYLATNPRWAYMFGKAVFKKWKPWGTITFRMTFTAHSALLSCGSHYEFHPDNIELFVMQSTYEFKVPPQCYATFNGMMSSGQIVATPPAPSPYKYPVR